MVSGRISRASRGRCIERTRRCVPSLNNMAFSTRTTAMIKCFKNRSEVVGRRARPSKLATTVVVQLQITVLSLGWGGRTQTGTIMQTLEALQGQTSKSALSSFLASPMTRYGSTRKTSRSKARPALSSTGMTQSYARHSCSPTIRWYLSRISSSRRHFRRNCQN